MLSILDSLNFGYFNQISSMWCCFQLYIYLFWQEMKKKI